MQATTSMPLPHRPMLHALAKSWWVLLLRGIAAIIFGVLAFAWPGLTLVTLVLLYGAFALVDGALSLIAAFTGSAKPIPTWWLIVVGLLGIAAGGVTFLWPGITAVLLVMFIGAWALVHGIFEIIGAIQLRKEIDNEWMLIFGGLLSVLFGIVVLIAPGAGAIGLIWAIATYSILFGITFVALAFRLRSHVHSTSSGVSRPPLPNLCMQKREAAVLPAASFAIGRNTRWSQKSRAPASRPRDPEPHALPVHPWPEPVAVRAFNQAACKLSAADFPVRRSLTISNVTLCPSLRVPIPARSTALTWTKTSCPPFSG